jgi:hypothetical protein
VEETPGNKHLLVVGKKAFTPAIFNESKRLMASRTQDNMSGDCKGRQPAAIYKGSATTFPVSLKQAPHGPLLSSALPPS